MTGWSIGLCDAIGFIASALTLTTFAQRSMIPMRLSALGANVFFIGYGALGPFPPVLALHVALLPLNARRLVEHWRNEHPAGKRVRFSYNSGRRFGGALLLVTLCVVPHGSDAARPPSEQNDWAVRGARMCAAFDLLYLTLLEEQGDAGEEEPENLASAASDMLFARTLCREGHHDAGVARYSAIGLTAPATRTLR